MTGLIQILGLRDYVTDDVKRKVERFFGNKWRANSVKHLFDNLETFLEQIPKDEHYNLFYTAANCVEVSGRILAEQHVIPFDLDEIDLDRIEEYIDPTLKELGRTRENTAVIATGNGLHFIIGIDEPIMYEDYFEDHKKYYKALCGNIANALFEVGLVAKVDTSVFSKGRILRLPLTENVKEKQGTKQSTFITRNIEYLPFDLVESSKFPMVAYEDAFTKVVQKHENKPDPIGVQEGCAFLNWSLHNQALVDEPQWYAGLSIYGRLEGAEELIHEYSKGHPQYSERETTRKWKQALDASGPRLCSNIETMWDGCPSCENYQCGIKSPIQIKSKAYIKTQDTGFYNMALSKDGTEHVRSKPNYDDLMNFYDQKNPFKAMEEEGSIFIHNGKYWIEQTKSKIHQFAENNFNPKPMENMRREFRSKLQCNNVEELSWFEVKNKINFNNGTLDLETMELIDHASDVGFKYVLPFDYSPTAVTDRFDRFMKEITCGDGDMETLLLEFMGYSLSGHDASFAQKALILLGEGSNGKSVFLDLLAYLAGKDNFSSLSMGTEISKLENRYQLEGKLFNMSEETPTDAMMDNTIFKALVSGGTIQARKLFCNSYSLKNNAKIIMACNRLPKNSDTSYGMFRRLLIVPFNALFSDKDEDYDPLILDKLKGESSGIYNRVLEAYLAFVKRGTFTKVTVVTRQVADYRQVTGWTPEESAKEWWKDRTVEDGAILKIACTDFYQLYKIETEMEGEKPLSRKQFAYYIKEFIPDEQRFKARINGKVGWCYSGIRIAHKGDDDVN